MVSLPSYGTLVALDCNNKIIADIEPIEGRLVKKNGLTYFVYKDKTGVEKEHLAEIIKIFDNFSDARSWYLDAIAKPAYHLKATGDSLCEKAQDYQMRTKN